MPSMHHAAVKFVERGEREDIQWEQLQRTSFASMTPGSIMSVFITPFGLYFWNFSVRNTEHSPHYSCARPKRKSPPSKAKVERLFFFCFYRIPRGQLPATCTLWSLRFLWDRLSHHKIEQRLMIEVEKIKRHSGLAVLLAIFSHFSFTSHAKWPEARTRTRKRSSPKFTSDSDHSIKIQSHSPHWLSSILWSHALLNT